MATDGISVLYFDEIMGISEPHHMDVNAKHQREKGARCTSGFSVHFANVMDGAPSCLTDDPCTALSQDWCGQLLEESRTHSHRLGGVRDALTTRECGPFVEDLATKWGCTSQ